jgi:nitric-oxide synthase, brain
MNTQRYAGELQYKPGDHVGLFATNRKELVDVILSKVSNAPPPDQLIKIEVLKEKATVFGINSLHLSFLCIYISL